MLNPRRILPVIAVVTLATGKIACGCGEDASSVPLDAGSDAPKLDAVPDVPQDALAIDPACGIPGYTLDTGYDPKCGFCYAASRAALPSQVKWRSCPSTATPNGVACRMMDFDWSPAAVPNGFKPQFIVPPVAATVSGDGSVVLGVYRSADQGTFRVVAAADGETKQSLFEANPSSCHMFGCSLGDGRVAYAVSQYVGDAGQEGSYGGALAGSYDSLSPTVHIRHTNEGNEDYIVSAFGLLEVALAGGGTIRRYLWDSGVVDSTLYVASDHSVALSFVGSQGSSAYWSTFVSLAINRETIWTEDAGAVDLISFGSDFSQGATALGTDGVDMVWHYGSQRKNPNDLFPVNDVMTAPYTTDPAQLKARRLRSDGVNLPDKYVVGCGYAAHQWALDLSGNVAGILLVRLADGQSWILGPLNNSPWVYESPIALTCTELFAVVAADGVFNVARIRLDSLGVGLVPD